ncbi:MAG: YdcF family protein [Lentisphaerales bacterium]|nr:YdcF family protein [Lentisphaerales bacterium]
MYKSKELFEFLSIKDELPSKVDLIIGFGHFDSRIAKTCADLYKQGYADKILFTGGIGAGTADIDKPEAEYFRKVAQAYAAEIPDAAFIIESESTNTGENISFSQKTLLDLDDSFHFDAGIQTAILVASPYRQMRVLKSMEHLCPKVKAYNFPPESDFEAEKSLFHSKSQDLKELLDGELQRLIEYPQLGYFSAVEIPPQFL